jgi:hypothetical protein
MNVAQLHATSSIFATAESNHTRSSTDCLLYATSKQVCVELSMLTTHQTIDQQQAYRNKIMLTDPFLTFNNMPERGTLKPYTNRQTELILPRHRRF